MPRRLADLLVFVTSGCVLVLEILAARLLAPYVGVTLETYTAIIGTMLAGIAAGTWAGGAASDRLDPRRLIGPLLVAGGALAVASIPLVRGLGRTGGGENQAVVLAMAAFLLPAAVLSAVSPAVVKLQLRDLAETGSVVGRLSALGTAGAILGTFLAGFVLVEAAPTSTSIAVVGVLLLVAGVPLWVRLGRPAAGSVAAVVVVALVGTPLAVLAGDPCDRETTYHCARIEDDPDRAGGRLLLLDTVRHSYVDLDDPTHLEFAYTRAFGAVVEALAPAGALDVLHVGGGGFTMPRHIAATRPGSTATVLEIDGGVVDLVRDRLDLASVPDLDVRVGDARVLLTDIPAGSVDVVLGDAFGGLAVPWHLTTEEAATDIARTLRDGGVYAVNVIDYPPLRFARAEVATLRAVFDHVALVTGASTATGDEGGNLVLVASDSPLDTGGLADALAGELVVVAGRALDGFAGGAPVLRDDHAPVDQWLGQGRARALR